MGLGTLRNNPCNCGSGKKFKRCCLGKPADQIRYKHVHDYNDPNALCLTCREIAQKLAVKSVMPVEEITAEL